MAIRYSPPCDLLCQGGGEADAADCRSALPRFNPGPWLPWQIIEIIRFINLLILGIIAFTVSSINKAPSSLQKSFCMSSTINATPLEPDHKFQFVICPQEQANGTKRILQLKKVFLYLRKRAEVRIKNTTAGMKE